MEEPTKRVTRVNRGQNMKRHIEELLSNDVKYFSSQSTESTNKKQRVEKDVKVTKSDTEDHADTSSQDEYDGEVRCRPCGATKDNYDEDEDTLGDMVQCDQCKTWQHAKCMGYKTKRSIPNIHKCDVCTGKPIPQSKRTSNTKTIKEEEEEEENDDDDIIEITDVKEKKSFANLKDEVRISTFKAFYNFFKKVIPKDGDNTTEEAIESRVNDMALEIESIIHENFSGKAYPTEARRILFVLKKHFMQEIFDRTITFKDVVHKTPQEINADIAKIEKQNKKNIKNIILTENDNTQIIRRTHKGEIIKENDFERSNQIDESITTRKVDHRHFSPDIVPESNFISHTKSQSKSYNNLNPRFDEDDEEDTATRENEEQEEEEKEEEEGTEATTEVVESENSETNQLQGENKSTPKSSESLSDVDSPNHNEADDGRLYSFLSGVDNPVTDERKIENKHVWSGRITFPEFATFKAKGEFYTSTDYNDKPMDHLINTTKDILHLPAYTILGRLDRHVADKYLPKVIGSRDFYFVQILNDDANDDQFQKLYQYLLIKNKVGVLSGQPSFVKDSYLIPIDFRDENLPPFLKNSRRDLRIGLFALFVVRKDYQPRARSFETNGNNHHQHAKEKEDEEEEEEKGRNQSLSEVGHFTSNGVQSIGNKQETQDHRLDDILSQLS
ncbi:hypothetical protein MGO_04176 [Candida albicans P76055]|nr:hypothetical protein MGO_04176 [Candida albicans P76055]